MKTIKNYLHNNIVVEDTRTSITYDTVKHYPILLYRYNEQLKEIEDCNMALLIRVGDQFEAKIVHLSS